MAWLNPSVTKAEVSRYYIAALAADAKVFGNAVRAHWGEENQRHWTLDATFLENDSRIRHNNAPANFKHVASIRFDPTQALPPDNECAPEEGRSSAGQ